MSTGVSANGSGSSSDETEADEDEETPGKAARVSGFTLEYDAARKIAQGLGAHLERLTSLVEIRGDTARLLPVSERTRFLFGKDEAQAPTARRKKKDAQLQLGFMEALEQGNKRKRQTAGEQKAFLRPV